MATLNLTGASAPTDISNNDLISSWNETSDLRRGRELCEDVASFLGRCFSHLARKYRVHCGLRSLRTDASRLNRALAGEGSRWPPQRSRRRRDTLLRHATPKQPL